MLVFALRVKAFIAGSFLFDLNVECRGANRKIVMKTSAECNTGLHLRSLRSLLPPWTSGFRSPAVGQGGANTKKAYEKTL